MVVSVPPRRVDAMTTPPYQPPQYPAAPQPMNPADERLWATLVHVGGIFFNFVPALIGYLVLKDRGPVVRHPAMLERFEFLTDPPRFLWPVAFVWCPL